MLDDIAEKSRRNLMVVACGILAVWILGIPLDGKLVGAVDLSAVQPWRAWLAATVVLSYFAVRYRLAPSTAKELEKWKTRRKSMVDVILEERLSTALSQSKKFENSRDLQLLIDERRPNEHVELGQPKRPYAKKRRARFTYFWQLTKGARVASLLEVSNFDPSEYPTEYKEGEYVFSRRFYYATQWRALREAYSLSWQLTELTIPWAVTGAAFVVCLCHLASSLYYSFPFACQLLRA